MPKISNWEKIGERRWKHKRTGMIVGVEKRLVGWGDMVYYWTNSSGSAIYVQKMPTKGYYAPVAHMSYNIGTITADTKEEIARKCIRLMKKFPDGLAGVTRSQFLHGLKYQLRLN